MTKKTQKNLKDWDIPSGSRIDSFEIIRKIGHGAMGMVYLARDVKLGRKTALKFINPQLLLSEEMEQRFMFEAHAMAKLSHPHIVTIFTVGETDGIPYIALEYLEGHTLRDRLNLERLNLQEALQLGLSISEAVAAAHEKMILHRDLKPENIFLPTDGRLRVMDFGIAKMLSFPGPSESCPADPGGATVPLTESAPEAFFTKSRGVKGTYPYIAPEIWLEKEPSPAADIWSIGVIMFEMIAHERPYVGAWAKIATEVCSKDPAPDLREKMPGTSFEVSELIGRCLSKDPEARFTAVQLVEELGRLAGRSHRAGRSAEESPFRGLLPFNKKHADIFFGRDSEIAASLEKIRNHPILPVIGPSGAGKSSFVMAGLIPALEQQGDWTFLVIRPGDRPFRSLASEITLRTSTYAASTKGSFASLAVASEMSGSPSIKIRQLSDQFETSPAMLGSLLRKEASNTEKRVLLVVDQMEELYTQVDDPVIREKFADTLTYAADDALSPVRIVFTLRDDFLGFLAEHRGLSSAMEKGPTLLRSPSRSSLVEILTRPIEPLGYGFEDENLVDEMVRAVSNEPAGLPLVQFAAQRLWEERDKKKRLLLRSVYESIGGVEGALADHADRIIEEMTSDQTKVARSILIRLTTEEGTRAQAGLQDITDELGEKAEKVVEKLVSGRLLVTRRISVADDIRGSEPSFKTIIELAHESLVKRWDRLRKWREESREDMAMLSQVRSAAAIWIRHERRHEDLWRGESLTEALKWRERYTGDLHADIREFLQEAQDHAAGIERRKKLIRVGIVTAAVIIAVLSVIATIFVSHKERQARVSEEKAVDAGEKARIRMAEALISDAEAAFLRENFPEARAKLRTAFETGDNQRGRALWSIMKTDPRYFKVTTGWLNYNVEFSPDGKILASSGGEGMIRLWDYETGKVRFLRGSGYENWFIDFSPDGKLLASGELDGKITLWDMSPAENRISKVLPVEKSQTLPLQFSSDGKQFVALSRAANILYVWDARSFNEPVQLNIKELTGLDSYVIELGPDDQTMAIGHRQGDISLLDLRTMEVFKTFTGHKEGADDFEFKKNGSILYSTSTDGTVRKWDLSTGDSSLIMQGTSFDIGLSPDNSILTIGAVDGGIIAWNIDENLMEGAYHGHTAPPSDFDYSSDGRFLASCGFDKTVRVWKADAIFAGELASHMNDLSAVSYSPDGKWAASGAWDSRVILWNIETGNSTLLQGHSEGIRMVAFSPDSRLLASAGNDRTIRLWDVSTSRSVHILTGHKNMVWGVVFSHDGKRLYSSAYDDTIRIWDVEQGKILKTQKAERGDFRGIAMSPDGKLIAAGVNEGISVLDSGSLREIRFLPVNRLNRCTFVDFSGDSALVASGSTQGGLKIWETANGKLYRSLGKETAPADGIAFSPDGKLIASAHPEERYIRIWDVEGGKLLTKLMASDGEIGIDFSPDGKLIVSGNEYSGVHVYNLAKNTLWWRAPLMLTKPEAIVLTHEGLFRLQSHEEKTTERKPIESLEARLRDPVRAALKRAFSCRADDDETRMTCITMNEHVELWDLKTGSREARQSIPGIESAFPVPGGFVVLASGKAQLWSCVEKTCKSSTLVDKAASAISVTAGKLLVATPERIHFFSSAGNPETAIAGETGISAMLLLETGIAIGFSDGNIELRSLDQESGSPAVMCDGTAGSPVTSIVEGPAGSIAAGFANGMVGIWSLSDGKKLYDHKLHGPVIHLRVFDQFLYAATEMGSTFVHDLSMFYRDYCSVLEDVWKGIPVVWEEGQVVMKPPDPGHPCKSKKVQTEI